MPKYINPIKHRLANTKRATDRRNKRLIDEARRYDAARARRYMNDNDITLPGHSSTPRNERKGFYEGKRSPKQQTSMYTGYPGDELTGGFPLQAEFDAAEPREQVGKIVEQRGKALEQARNFGRGGANEQEINDIYQSFERKRNAGRDKDTRGRYAGSRRSKPFYTAGFPARPGINGGTEEQEFEGQDPRYYYRGVRTEPGEHVYYNAPSMTTGEMSYRDLKMAGDYGDDESYIVNPDILMRSRAVHGDPTYRNPLQRAGDRMKEFGTGISNTASRVKEAFNNARERYNLRDMLDSNAEGMRNIADRYSAIPNPSDKDTAAMNRMKRFGQVEAAPMVERLNELGPGLGDGSMRAAIGRFGSRMSKLGDTIGNGLSRAANWTRNVPQMITDAVAPGVNRNYTASSNRASALGTGARRLMDAAGGLTSRFRNIKERNDLHNAIDVTANADKQYADAYSRLRDPGDVDANSFRANRDYVNRSYDSASRRLEELGPGIGDHGLRDAIGRFGTSVGRGLRGAASWAGNKIGNAAQGVVDFIAPGVNRNYNEVDRRRINREAGTYREPAVAPTVAPSRGPAIDGEDEPDSPGFGTRALNWIGDKVGGIGSAINNFRANRNQPKPRSVLNSSLVGEDVIPEEPGINNREPEKKNMKYEPGDGPGYEHLQTEAAKKNAEENNRFMMNQEAFKRNRENPIYNPQLARTAERTEDMRGTSYATSPHYATAEDIPAVDRPIDRLAATARMTKERNAAAQNDAIRRSPVPPIPDEGEGA
jgi:hypothetical protein